MALVGGEVFGWEIGWEVPLRMNEACGRHAGPSPGRKQKPTAAKVLASRLRTETMIRCAKA